MSRIRIIAAAIVLGMAAVLSIAVPASAHDELVSSTPLAGDQLAEAPATVSLVFSDEVLPMGAAVIVVDASGHDWVNTEPVLAETTVTAELDAGMPAAGYEVRWRVVSSDGHPISGVIPFTVGDAAPLARSSPSAGPVANGTDTQNQSTTQDPGLLRVVLIGAGGAAIAVAVFLTISFIRRRTAAAAVPGEHASPDS